MRLILITTPAFLLFLLALINVTQQEKAPPKLRKGNEFQKLQERVPVKNYLSIHGNENRKVNKYKDDISEESDESQEVFESSSRDLLAKKKPEKNGNSDKNYENKKDEKKAAPERNRKSYKIDSNEFEQNIKRKEGKNNFNPDKEGPKKYSKQKHQKMLDDDDDDDDNDKIPNKYQNVKQKKKYNSPEANIGKKQVNNKYKVKKGSIKDNESSEEDDTDTESNDTNEDSRKKDLDDDDDDSQDEDDSLQCDSLDDENCDV